MTMARLRMMMTKILMVFMTMLMNFHDNNDDPFNDDDNIANDVSLLSQPAAWEGGIPSGRREDQTGPGQVGGTRMMMRVMMKLTMIMVKMIRKTMMIADCCSGSGELRPSSSATPAHPSPSSPCWRTARPPRSSPGRASQPTTWRCSSCPWTAAWTPPSSPPSGTR